MKDPIRVGRARRRLWLAIGFAVTAAVVAAFAWPASEPVKLLHVGFANHGDRGISPVLCLTNGGTKAIIYSDDSGATASFRYSVQSDSGWFGPYTNRGGFGMAPEMDVLKPGESMHFEFNRPLGPRGWRIGIAYYSCETVQPVTQPNRGPIRVASAVRV